MKRGISNGPIGNHRRGNNYRWIITCLLVAIVLVIILIIAVILLSFQEETITERELAKGKNIDLGAEEKVSNIDRFLCRERSLRNEDKSYE